MGGLGTALHNRVLRPIRDLAATIGVAKGSGTDVVLLCWPDATHFLRAA